ncbi:2TM domain-containing protein [Pseudonocardia zijingensis]|uniref:2TM domain-containing protein n=1 Tax=Pseudonocardia zijingensis TaxID=153376 RepID=A0ABN1P5J8_9PSEU
MDDDHDSRPETGDELRTRAVQRLRARRDFPGHVAIYLAVNLFLIGIWWFTGAGFFWPVFPIFAWGIGVAGHAWDVYGRGEPTEEQIRREMDRLRK